MNEAARSHGWLATDVGEAPGSDFGSALGSVLGSGQAARRCNRTVESSPPLKATQTRGAGSQGARVRWRPAGVRGFMSEPVARGIGGPRAGRYSLNRAKPISRL